MDLRELDEMRAEEAARLLASCCGSSRWVELMLGRRPFGARAALFEAADDVWAALDSMDWLEAFAHHPRIGEKNAARGRSSLAGAWARTEQSEMADASSELKEAIAAANEEYERRFGYIYIVCASGRSAAELLHVARERLRNSPDVEIAVAAEEQRKITRLRLEKLLSPSESEAS